MSEIRDDELLRRLAETIAWCTGVADPAHELRSPALQPPHPRDEPLGGFDLGFAARCAVVDRLAGRRRALLRSLGVSDPALPPGGGGGRILLSAGADENIDECASQSASDGYFDEDDLPPWDTWLTYVDGEVENEYTESMYGPGRTRLFLVAWVPPEHVRSAEDGLFANPYGAIVWADDLDAPITRRLRELGVLAPR